MKIALLSFIPILAGGAGIMAARHATAQGEGRQVQVVGHINILDAVAPTAERLADLQMPSGFRVTRFAPLQNPRLLCMDPVTGNVYASSYQTGTVTVLRDPDQDGVADTAQVVFRRQNAHGLAIRGRELWVVTVREVYKNAILPDGTLGPAQLIVNDLPDAGQHNNRSAKFGPDGMLYISVGSTCNECREGNEENATMLRLDPATGKRTIFASGLRNTIGFDWHPVSKKLYGLDNGTDWLGDDEQPEELNEITQGSRYGWPYVFGFGKLNDHFPPPAGFTSEGWRAMSKEPVLGYVAHSAPMQLVYSTGSMFPAEYRNDGFATMRGSWNRLPSSGYEIVRIRFNAAGIPQSMEPFLTGFKVDGGGMLKRNAAGEEVQTDAHMGRLCGLVQLRDGSLLFADDTNSQIYRLSYNQPDAPSAPDQDELTINKVSAPMNLTVTSASFKSGATIPLVHSDYGDRKSPQLTWSRVPSGTKSIVALCEDPDSFSPKPYAHWLVANLPATMTALPLDVPRTPSPAALGGGIQGTGYAGVLGYFGPKPPAKDPAHAYHFQVMALDTKLDLKPGFTRAELTDKVKGHVIGKGEIVGMFKKEG